jgi:hypothetical protein
VSWSIGYDERWQRDIGYGVPATCDHPDCNTVIDRGLGYVCGGQPYGGEHGCGLYFCESHLWHGFDGVQRCDRCADRAEPFDPKPDTSEWVQWKLTDGSWAEWRAENPELVAAMGGGVS